MGKSRHATECEGKKLKIINIKRGKIFSPKIENLEGLSRKMIYRLDL